LAVDVKLFEDLDAVERDAGGDLDRTAQAELFDRLQWFRLVERHSPPPGRLLVLRARNDGEGWSRSRSWLFLAVKDRHATAFANWYSLRVGTVNFQPDPAGSPDCWEAIADALRRSGRIASLDLYPHAHHPGELVSCFRRAGWIARAMPVGVSWRMLTLDLDFARYWASRPSRLRNSTERKAKAARLDIVVHREFDPEAWAAYEEVYAASWKPGEGSPAFLRALAEQEGAAGTLRLGIARKDGRPLAAQLWLVENGTAWIHKLAYREDSKTLSPGSVLSMAMFRSAIDEDRVAWIDYGIGDEGYKRDWMEERSALSRVEAWNPRSLRGLAGAGRAWLSALVRRARSR
jgi:CelD/BcsL family acetyltransferase involved in cellulose biosynthesis